MALETLNDVIEWLADAGSIYGCGPEEGDHPEDCTCRICFCEEANQRIRAAIAVERKLKEVELYD